MMKSFFIFGRNPELSRAELYSYFKGNSIGYKELVFHRNYAIVESDEFKLNIQDFGGIMKAGRISFSGSFEGFYDFLKGHELVDAEKFTYAIFGNTDDELLVEKFRTDKKRAIIRRGRKNLQLQKGRYVSLPKAEIEFFMHEEDDDFYFGAIEQDYSYEQVKERDMKKPVRRESLAISPRLAKILVNLSQTKKGGLVLDAFCGVGGIMQEALLRGINAYGIDKDARAIEDAKRNLKWLENNFDIKANYKLLNTDAKSAPNISFDGVASEPALGKTFRKKPKEREAEEFIRQFENLIIGVLQKLKKLKKKDAKIAITIPFIRSHFADIKRICRETSLNIYGFDDIKFPIKEFREDQFVGREFVVFI